MLMSLRRSPAAAILLAVTLGISGCGGEPGLETNVDAGEAAERTTVLSARRLGPAWVPGWLRGGAGGAAPEDSAPGAERKPWGAFQADPDRDRAAALMQQRGLENCEKAVGLLRGALQRNPGDLATSMELADALNAVMRIKTNANALVIDGSLDTPGNKKIWKTLGDEALPLAKQAYDAKPDDVKALAVYADAFMFSCSAKGIVKQALSGTANEYKRVANELRKHPDWDGAVGNVFLGGLYNVAPWPVGNKAQARELLGEAANIAPTRRNLYYVGVNAFQLGEYGRAAQYFDSALKADCGSATEKDFGNFLLQESRSGLQRAQKALALEQVETSS